MPRIIYYTQCEKSDKIPGKLLNSLRKSDQMLGKPRIKSLFPNSFNKLNKTWTHVLDPLYIKSHDTGFPTIWYVRPTNLRSACAYAQSDQSLRYSLEYFMSVKLLTERRLEFLSLKGDCTCSSESTLIKMSNCWKSYASAQFILLYSMWKKWQNPRQAIKLIAKKWPNARQASHLITFPQLIL